MGGENIWLSFWDILRCQVQNDLKTLGNSSLGSDLNFLKNAKNGSAENLVTRLGHFEMSGAEKMLKMSKHVKMSTLDGLPENVNKM